MKNYKPKFGEHYYHISHCVNCIPNILKRLNVDDLDKSRIAEGNCYKTKKEAEKALKEYKEEWLKTHDNLIKEEVCQCVEES